MFKICLFGAYDGRLESERQIVFTMFGAAELRRPTIARQLVQQRARQGPTTAPLPRRQVPAVVTIFGATEIKLPTMAEEFIDLQEAVRSGVLPLAEWDRAVAELSSFSATTVFTVTLFGACDEAELPSEDEEVESFAIQRHMGRLSEETVDLLKLGVGQAEAHRRSILRQALAAGA